MSNKTDLTEEDLVKLVSIGRKALLTVFLVLVIMLFHVLIDLFYHT